jgi:Leucine-rich repeat (LRR) protein
MFVLFVFCVLSISYARTSRDDSLVVAEILAVNGLSHIDVSSVTSFSSSMNRLYGLYLEDKGIHVLPECIGNLDSLRNLTIPRNNLSILPQSIGNLSKLEYFYCQDNYLYELPSGFSNLQNLKTAYFIRNRFTKWPEVFYSMPSLEILDMGGNNLTEIPDRISECTTLKKLYINDNFIRQLPEAITDLPLELVHIAGNALCTLSTKVVNWLDLHDYYKTDSKWRTYQYCSRYSTDIIKIGEFLKVNGWSDIPPDSAVIVENGNIVGIDVSAARRAKLGMNLSPNSPGHTLVLYRDMIYLKHLRSLNLSGNNIVSIPSTMDTLCHLEHLDLSNNSLTTLPEDMIFFRNLKSLSLSNNQISFVTDAVGQWADTYSPGWRNEQIGTVKTSGIKRSSVATVAAFVSSVNSSIIQVRFNKPLSAEIALFDVSGRFITSLRKGRFETGGHSFTIDGLSLPKGAFLITIKSGNSVIDVKKLVR